MGVVLGSIILLVEGFFLGWTLLTKCSHTSEKNIVRLAEFILLGILYGTGILKGSFRYIALLGVLGIQSIGAVIHLIQHKEVTYKCLKQWGIFFRNSVLYCVTLTLAILCPQFKEPVVTGPYLVKQAKYTWVNENQVEPYKTTGEKRALTVNFWYPQQVKEKCPLVVFSHGAFGIAEGNGSTFKELASNGYVVASISHPYHAMFTKEASGKIILGSKEFVDEVYSIQGKEDTKEKYAIKKKWLDLRMSDEQFVIDKIKQEVERAEETPFRGINLEKIGLFGHSLGGASSAQLGRERTDIDAVIVIDGTQFGEEVEFKEGRAVLNEEPYPVPILNIYAEDHYKQAIEAEKLVEPLEYDNFYMTKYAVCAYETVFKKAGHLNFTDLPLFCPTLAKKLGIGTIDKYYCIETMNTVVKDFFDCYLKDSQQLHIEKEY